jgi:hypothetical protein
MSWFEKFNKAIELEDEILMQEICLPSSWRDNSSLFGKVLFNKFTRQGLQLEEQETLTYYTLAVSKAKILKDNKTVGILYLQFKIEDQKILLGSTHKEERLALAYVDGLVPLYCDFHLLEQDTAIIDGFNSLMSKYDIMQMIEGCSEINNQESLDAMAIMIDHPPKVFTDSRILQLMDEFKDFTVGKGIYISRISRGMVELINEEEGNIYVCLDYFEYNNEWKIIGGGTLPLMSELLLDHVYTQKFQPKDIECT